MLSTRRTLLSVVAASAVLPVLPARAEDLTRAERFIGKADAKTTVIECYSMTCSHCAAFAVETMPQIKRELIDTGRIKYVFHDFPLDGVAMTASMVARYLPVDRYAPFVDALLHTQDRWAFARGVNSNEEIWKFAALAALLLLAGCNKSAPEAAKEEAKAEGPGITLTEEESEAMGLATAKLQAASYRGELSGFGVVSTFEAIAQSDADSVTAEASAAQSGAAAARARDLSTGADAPVSRETYEAAAAKSTAAPTATSPASAASGKSAAGTAAAAARVRIRSGESDGVNHDVFFFRALHHVFERVARRAGIERRVHAVGEHEDDAPALLMQQRGDADVDSIPQRRRPFLLQLGAQNRVQLFAIGREIARVDLDAVREAADARLVSGEHHVDEMFGGLLHEREVGFHAAAAVEQHDDGDRLHVVREEREHLRLPVVENRKCLAREIRHEPPVRSSDGRIDRDCSRRAAKCRFLGGGNDREAEKRDNDSHGTH